MERTFGGEAEDWFTDLAAIDGGFLLVGTTYSTEGGQFAGWLLTATSEGDEVASQRIGQENDQVFSAVHVLADGRAIAAGYSRGEQSAPNVAWAVLVDTDRKVEWSRRFNARYLYGATSLVGGGMAVVGVGNSGERRSAGWVAAIDDGGSTLWEAQIDDEYGDAVYAVAPRHGGGVVVAAIHPVDQSTTGPAVIAYDADGAFLWEHRLGLTGGQLTSIEALPGGGYAVAGYWRVVRVAQGPVWRFLDEDGRLCGSE
jgi:hypothetical protein